MAKGRVSRLIERFGDTGEDIVVLYNVKPLPVEKAKRVWEELQEELENLKKR